MFWSIFARAQELGVPIYLHPANIHPAVAKAYLNDYASEYPGLMNAGWGFDPLTARLPNFRTFPESARERPRGVGRSTEPESFTPEPVRSMVERPRHRTWKCRTPVLPRLPTASVVCIWIAGEPVTPGRVNPRATIRSSARERTRGHGT